MEKVYVKPVEVLHPAQFCCFVPKGSAPRQQSIIIPGRKWEFQKTEIRWPLRILARRCKRVCQTNNPFPFAQHHLGRTSHRAELAKVYFVGAYRFQVFPLSTLHEPTGHSSHASEAKVHRTLLPTQNPVHQSRGWVNQLQYRIQRWKKWVPQFRWVSFSDWDWVIFFRFHRKSCPERRVPPGEECGDSGWSDRAGSLYGSQWAGRFCDTYQSKVAQIQGSKLFAPHQNDDWPVEGWTSENEG